MCNTKLWIKENIWPYNERSVKLTEIHTAEQLVPEHSSFEFEIAIENLQRCKLPGIDQILAELIQSEGKTLCSDIHKHVHSIWNREELIYQ
jgi:hypothetical protein